MRFSLVSLCIALIVGSWAQGASQQSVNSDDLSKFADQLRPAIKVTPQPFYLYHWQDTHRAPQDLYNSQFLPYVRDGVDVFWKTRGGPSDDVLGVAMYFATDPVWTRDFGGTEGNWMLVQLHIPTGFKYIDLNLTSKMVFPLAIRKALTAHGCPKSWETAKDYFQKVDHAYGAKAQCIDVIHTLLDSLEIDALSYPFTEGWFFECGPPYGRDGISPERSQAFVPISAKKLSEEDVRVYNAISKYDRENRVRIMSLFYKSDHDAATGKFMFPKSNDDYATPTPEAEAKAPAIPKIMSTANVPNHDDSTYSFLWPDLDGEALDPDLVPWMKQNILGCGVKK